MKKTTAVKTGTEVKQLERDKWEEAARLYAERHREMLESEQSGRKVESLNNFMKKTKPKSNIKKSQGTPVYAVMKVAVFPKGTGLYSDELTEVEFIDEGGNGYIQITQEDRFININFEEWPALRSAIELTLNGADKFLPNDAF